MKRRFKSERFPVNILHVVIAYDTIGSPTRYNMVYHRLSFYGIVSVYMKSDERNCSCSMGICCVF